MEGRSPSPTGTPASTPWTEQQHQEHYAIVQLITNQPGGIRASSARSTSHFDFDMQMLASAAQMRGVNAAGPTLPYRLDSPVGTNRVVNLPEPVLPHIHANVTDATDSPLSASASASTGVTGAMTSAGLNIMKTTESVTAADSTNIIDGVKRRSAMRKPGAHGLPPPTPHSTGSERSATMSDQAEAATLTAQGPAQITEKRQKGHCKATPKHLLSQNPKAIASRAKRAAESRRAGKNQTTIPPGPAATSATPINPNIRHPASGRVTHALAEPASTFPAVTPAKRTATDDTESTIAKRRCIMLSQASFDDASETVATPNTVPALIDRGSTLQKQQRTPLKLTTPGAPTVDAEDPATPPLSTKVVLHPTTGRPVPAQSLADIAKYSQDTEDLDWTNCKDSKKRLRMQRIIQDRKRHDRKVAKMPRKKSRTSEIEALINTREIRKSTEPGSFGLRASTVHEGDEEVVEPVEGTSGPVDRDEQSAEPARETSSCQRSAHRLYNPSRDDQGLAKPASRSIVTARPLSAQSSADIVKYSLAGEDLDWSKCHNISERKRMQNLIHRRKCDEKKANKTRKAKTRICGGGILKAVEPTEHADTVQVAHEEGGDENAEHEGIEDEEADVAVAESEQAENQEAEYEEVEDQEAEVEEAANENEEADVAAPEDEEADVEEVVNDNGRMGNTAYNTPNPESLRSDEVQTIDFVGGTFSEQEYVQDLRAILDRICKSKSNAFYTRQCRRIGKLLAVASPPKSGEMLIKTTNEQAAKVVETNFYFPGPLVTYGQQPMPLQTQHQFFNEYYDETVQVHVQDPSARVAKYEPRVRIVNIATVKARFSQPVMGTPWNVLELAAHCDDGIRPAFLNNEDCTLLTKLKLPCTGETASRLGFTEGFQEVENTYITVNQGYVGFGWLSNPTDDERAAWSNAHDTYTGGRWRYVILRPGTTVYFPAGTIHFVFRHPAAGNTLAFGGHVLRCSQIVRWIKVLRAEQVNGNITNEDLSVSAPRYLDRVERFVRQAQKSGREEMWGGKGAIEEFLLLKQVFDAQAARDEKRLKKAGKRA
ncbi:hypothetical protein LTR74_016494 [Friedmanniomyces endolithicus]|nr:hypothetical protein LTR74_016494 [Friedmanniomyces endolithicus]